VALFSLKLILTPVLVIAVSLAERRWGPKTGGLLAGLPLTSAPISVFLALEQGSDFAANAAAGTLLGVGSVAAFCFAYALGAKRWGWLLCTTVGILCFIFFTATFRVVATGPIWATIITAVVLGVVLALFPHGVARSVTRRPPAWTLPGRAIVATGLVLLLTTAAPTLGARFSGLLSPLPVFANVLAAFSHAHDGPGPSTLLLRGIVLGLVGFAGFFFIVAWGLPRWKIWFAFGTATVIAMGISWLTYRLDHAA
jgi:hypothetical protein